MQLRRRRIAVDPQKPCLTMSALSTVALVALAIAIGEAKPLHVLCSCNKLLISPSVEVQFCALQVCPMYPWMLGEDAACHTAEDEQTQVRSAQQCALCFAWGMACVVDTSPHGQTSRSLSAVGECQNSFRGQSKNCLLFRLARLPAGLANLTHPLGSPS